MKKFIALAVFALMAVTTVAAQGYTPPPVEISTRKAKIDGVMYYSHRVQDKQTLYSLCKAYHVTEQEIRDANGGLEKGLQAGTEILIPAKLETEQEDVEEVTAAEDNVPKVAENTSEVTQTESVDEEEEAKYRIHRVKWHENIYTISIKYKISVATIVKVNNLKSKRLTTGQRIKIPKGSYLEYVQQTDGMERDTIINGNEGIEDDQDAVENQENENDEDDNKGSATFDGKAKIALILPFSASTNSPSDNYLDFYSGFLMAVKNAKEMGRNIELNVIDITTVSDKSEIGRAYSLEDYNFVVGPVSTSDLKPVAEYCSSHKVPVISPMDQKAAPLVEDYKYLIQYPTTANHQVKNLVRSCANTNVVVILESGGDSTYFKSVRRELEDVGITYKTLGYGILKGREISTLLKGKLSTGGQNSIIVASEKEAFASDAVRNLNILAKDSVAYRIAAYGSHRIRNFDSIEPEVFHNINMHFSMPYYVDYHNAATHDFVLSYRALFNTEPGSFAFQGYDIGTYFISALVKYGPKFIQKCVDLKMNLMQSNASFIRIEGGGLQNIGTKDIVYGPGYAIN